MYIAQSLNETLITKVHILLQTRNWDRKVHCQWHNELCLSFCLVLRKCILNHMWTFKTKLSLLNVPYRSQWLKIIIISKPSINQCMVHNTSIHNCNPCTAFLVVLSGTDQLNSFSCEIKYMITFWRNTLHTANNNYCKI